MQSGEPQHCHIPATIRPGNHHSFGHSHHLQCHRLGSTQFPDQRKDWNGENKLAATQR